VCDRRKWDSNPAQALVGLRSPPAPPDEARSSLSATRTIALLSALVAALLLVEMALLGVALWRGWALAAESRAFEARLPNAKRTLLVIGDSTAVGTGAERPENSVAGRLSRLVPDVEIINRAEDGARTGELIQQLGAAPGAAYDVILIQTGGNDILWFTGLRRLRAATTRLLQEAKTRAGRVVLMSTGDVGTAPAFPVPIDWLYSWRTRRVRELFIGVTARLQVEYVDLYDPGAENPFNANPEPYYATDGLHPSDAGYRLWFEQLTADSSILESLRTGEDSPLE
jgi:lysophospholipase L1-like esterase